MKRKIYTYFVAMVMLLTLFSGCSTGASENIDSKVESNESAKDENKAYPISIMTYTDEVENDVRKTSTDVYDKAPSKVALADQSMTDIMIELGLTDKIVGISNITNPILPKYQAEYDKLPVLGSFSKTAKTVNDLGFPTKEMMIASEPDMIIGWSGLFYDTAIGTISEWKEKGVHTFIVRNVSDMGSPKNLENNFTDIEDLGKIFNVEDKATNLLSPMKEKLKNVADIVSKANKKVTVLGVGLSNSDTYQVYGKGTLLADLIEHAGGELVQTDARATLSNENLIELNPDFIVYMDYASDIKTDEDGVKFFQANSALNSVNAVKNGNIIVSPSTRCFNGSLESCDEVERFAKTFYKELFK